MRARRIGLAVALAALVAGLVGAPVAAVDDDDDDDGGGPPQAVEVQVIAEGLNNPRQLDIGSSGRVLVSETGAGRILSIRGSGGTPKVVASGFPVVSSPEGASSVHGIAWLGDGKLTAMIGEGTNASGEDPRFNTLVKVKTSGVQQIADIGAYQAIPANQDPQDLDMPAFPAQSNGYGIAALRNGKTLIADAGGNDLLLVNRNGSIETVARFAPIPMTTAHLPFPFPAPQIDGEAVPTSVVVGSDGHWYVGVLTGFPFQPDAARIYRISPNARNVACQPNATTGPCQVWATGFTAIVAMDRGPGGDLFVVEMFEDGLFGSATDGALLRVDRKTKAVTEIADGQLNLPGGVTVRGDTVYVSTWSVTDVGQVVRIDLHEDDDD